MERRTFEDSLRDAFRDAEATPSDKVWTNVELELEKENGAGVRRRLVFYQMLAAAAVTLALLATGVGYIMVTEKNAAIEQMMTQTTPDPQYDKPEANDVIQSDQTRSENLPRASRELARAGEDGSAEELAEHPGRTRDGLDNGVSPSGDGAIANGSGTSGQGAPSGLADVNGTDIRRNASSAISSPSGPTRSNTSTIATVAAASASTASGSAATHASRALPEFYAPKIGKPSLNNTSADPVALMMAKLAEEEMKLASIDNKHKAVKEEKIWTALGVAAGGFSAVNRTTSPMQYSSLASYTNTSVPDKQAKASGVAYTMGLSFGTKVATRWIVQGGLNYMTQSSNYVATNVIASPGYASLEAESINALGKLPALADAAHASERLAPTVPYSVNNSLKYFSVPMQAGYLLVNRKFGVQLNAGISTDLFLENTITPEGGSLDKTTQSNGSDSPYRTINFSGLMGTEFTYRLGQRYRIALNPALRYPFNSVYKSDVGIASTPLTFDVGLRFRYIFK